MIETLYNLLGNAPVVGEPITMAYLGNRVKNAVTSTKDKKLDPKTAELAGEQLDSHLQDQANSIFDQEVQPYIAKSNLPDSVTNPLKEKAIAELVGVLKEKAVAKVTTTA
jgi:hypothetical protein